MTPEKKAEIKKVIMTMVDDLPELMEENIDKALNSGAIDENMENYGGAVIPKIIFCAIAEKIRYEYGLKGAYFEKAFNREVNNLNCFI